MRPLCECGNRPAAVNYKKNGKTFYQQTMRNMLAPWKEDVGDT